MTNTSDGNVSPIATQVALDVKARFLRYVKIDTRSMEDSEQFPSTAKQLDLSRLLVEELVDLGVEDARLDDNGYVLASLPGNGPAVGLLAHVDTSPEAPGAGVNPQVIEDYDGGEITYPGAPGQVLSPETSPALADQKGNDIITTDGTTLLGADDKAGVAAIMSAIAYLKTHPEVEHAPIRIAFTPDEEVGRGVSRFDIDGFGADIAYTIDGGRAGSIEDESFSASKMTVTFTGRLTHPGYAKDKMVNAVRLAADLVAALPMEESPERTEGRDGFVHPLAIEGANDSATVKMIVRDFDLAELDARIQRISELASSLVDGIEDASVEIETARQYLNMKEYLRDRPEVTELAIEAIRNAGLEPRPGIIRGGTDGSILTEKGLPTPNLFCGAHDIHSTREWVSVQDMGAAVATIVHLVRLWGAQDR